LRTQDPAKARWLAGSGTLLSGLLLFLLLPPLLFSHMEGWSYLESFYFAFVTLSTVGFGDFVIGECPGSRGQWGGLSASTSLPASTCRGCQLGPFVGWGAKGPPAHLAWHGVVLYSGKLSPGLPFLSASLCPRGCHWPHSSRLGTHEIPVSPSPQLKTVHSLNKSFKKEPRGSDQRSPHTTGQSSTTRGHWP
jgi:hypothetical protein